MRQGGSLFRGRVTASLGPGGFLASASAVVAVPNASNGDVEIATDQVPGGTYPPHCSAPPSRHRATHIRRTSSLEASTLPQRVASSCVVDCNPTPTHWTSPDRQNDSNLAGNTDWPTPDERNDTRRRYSCVTTGSEGRSGRPGGLPAPQQIAGRPHPIHRACCHSSCRSSRRSAATTWPMPDPRRS